jgi:hypothetical protein
VRKGPLFSPTAMRLLVRRRSAASPTRTALATLSGLLEYEPHWTQGQTIVSCVIVASICVGLGLCHGLSSIPISEESESVRCL